MSDEGKKYCEDCAHCYVPPSGLEHARCMVSVSSIEVGHFISKTFDVPEKRNRYCTSARSDNSSCGPEAKFFVAKLETENELAGAGGLR